MIYFRILIIIISDNIIFIFIILYIGVIWYIEFFHFKFFIQGKVTEAWFTNCPVNI